MEDREMALGEHLIELRKRIIVSCLAVLACSLVSFAYSDQLIVYLAQHVDELVFLSPPEAFITAIKVSILTGFLLALPVVTSQFWLFVVPALKPGERRALYIIIPASIGLFYAGFAFGFYLVLPMAIRFLIEVAAPTLSPMFTLRLYIAFILQLLIPFGLMFQLPLLSCLLVRLRLITANSLRQSRKYALVLIFVIAAILTPPDVVTQLLLALPILVLFEVSVFLAWLLRPRPEKQRKDRS